MTNYRDQDACINCRFVRNISNAPAPDSFHCTRIRKIVYRPKLLSWCKTIAEYATAVDASDKSFAETEVQPNGICDNYEHHNAEEQSKDESVLPNLPR